MDYKVGRVYSIVFLFLIFMFILDNTSLVCTVVYYIFSYFHFFLHPQKLNDKIVRKIMDIQYIQKPIPYSLAGS